MYLLRNKKNYHLKSVKHVHTELQVRKSTIFILAIRQGFPLSILTTNN